MDLSPEQHFAAAVRHDGWSPALKARFLAVLAGSGNVRLAARRCGRSAQSAYVQRRRDALFARGWAGALHHARDHAEQVLADRALEGVEEAVFFRGEQIGTRRRYDARLLLAHLARLDALVDDDRDGAAAAARFDELLAVIAGHAPPEEIAAASEDALMPCERDLFVGEAVAGAQDVPDASAADVEAALAAASALWDGWFDGACAAVDGLDDDPPPMEFKSLGMCPRFDPPRHGEVAAAGRPTEGVIDSARRMRLAPSTPGSSTRSGPAVSLPVPGRNDAAAYDPVNSVNFAAALLDFPPLFRHWPAPTESSGPRSSVRDSWCTGSARA